MVRKYSLFGILRFSIILTAIAALCLTCSCSAKKQASQSEQLAGSGEVADETGASAQMSQPDERENTTPPDETASPENSKPPEVPDSTETPDVTGAQPGPDYPPDPDDTQIEPEPEDDPVPSQDGEQPDSGTELTDWWNSEYGAEQSGAYPEPDKIAYITIDDGPTRSVTPLMLDILKNEGIKATFFVLPHSDVEDLYKRILDEGHILGNHSYSHKYKQLYAEDTAFFREDLIMMHNFLYDMLGYTATLYRFPGGAMSRKSPVIEVRAAILEEFGYSYFDWNSSTGDSDATGENKGTVTLIRNVLDKTNGRKKLVVLMHDSLGKSSTAEALPYIIKGLRMQGYAFDTLDNYHNQ